MGRKDFRDDIATAQALGLPDISDIRSTEDGELTFVFFPSAENASAKITAMLSDVSEYPKSHEYMVFASDDSPPSIADAVAAAPNTRRQSVPQFLTTLSKHLVGGSSTKRRQSMSDPDDDGDVELDDLDNSEASDYDDLDGDNEDWAMDDGFDDSDPASPHPSKRNFSGEASTATTSPRAKADLRTAKNAGFKIGALGALHEGNSCYVTVSCRLEKLGISEEAMAAWSLAPSNYLCLLLHFPMGYRDLQQLTSMEAAQARQYLTLRVGVCTNYKPTSLKEAQSFFKPASAESRQPDPNSSSSLHRPFISGPIDELLNDRLLRIINLRLSEDLSWWGAEQYYHELIGKQIKSSASNPRRTYRKSDTSNVNYPPRVTEDELTEVKRTSQLSFPLIAMQFLLRHFVRCTEFCMVCHTKIASQVDAIKPYVCDKPLCLYQYLNMGFGTRIEHEVLTQPLVVDLLISFCYCTAVHSTFHSKLREYPTGLGWMVPHPQARINGSNEGVSKNPYPSYVPVADSSSSKTTTGEPLPPAKSFRASLDPVNMRLTLDGNPECSLKRGDWILINIEEAQPCSWHVRVADVLLSMVSLTGSEPLVYSQELTKNGKSQLKKPEGFQKPINVECWKYEVNFDDLPDAEKARSMILLMELMPGVGEMRTWLLQYSNRKIDDWTTRMPPASFGLLRWIIASNRSCIMQAYEDLPESSGDDKWVLKPKKGEQRIQGIGNLLQFRFAMGAPDKEQRFISSLDQGKDKYPSLFAWHGSPLYNWHGIIREGLDFKETAHGRAYGNGCYHAPDWNTSMGYSGGMSNLRGLGGIHVSSGWPSSFLKINTAIALNEIVNAPEKFTSASPHYVVQHVDWIQTRYLFVQPSTSIQVVQDVGFPKEMLLPQDPSRIPRGPNGVLIELPNTTVPRARRPNPIKSTLHLPLKDSNEPRKSKKTKLSLNAAALAAFNAESTKSKVQGTQDNPIDLDAASVSTLEEDRELLQEQKPKPRPTPKVAKLPITPYFPGAIPNLPVLPPPTYATSKATKTIQKAWFDLRKTQDTYTSEGRLHELGWYLDIEHTAETDNLYQWIVQMHSFPLDIPLGQDMQVAGVTSVVFEIRFSANFPFSPPFIRVIRPRFLPFHEGGGGHVTLGGSICMDLLTSSGWSAAASIESVLLQIRMALMSLDPRPARLDCVVKGAGRGFGSKARAPSGAMAQGEYGVGEAVQAFVRACQTHGWQVPPELHAMTGGAVAGFSM